MIQWLSRALINHLNPHLNLFLENLVTAVGPALTAEMIVKASCHIYGDWFLRNTQIIDMMNSPDHVNQDLV